MTIRDSLAQVQARPLDDWHEDYGSCVWWTWENGKWLGEPAWIGGPLDSDWPGYHTHFTPHPIFPPPVNGPELMKRLDRHGAGDAEDAARYRWLKARSWGGSGAYYFKGPPYREGMTLDAAIDAARAGERAVAGG